MYNRVAQAAGTQLRIAVIVEKKEEQYSDGNEAETGTISSFHGMPV